jgi:2-hydroxychromene-2-carboxylate isomerase
MTETPRRHVDFFFSPGSRYCYLAATRLAEIETRTRCEFRWRPVNGVALRQLRGRDPFRGEPVSGQYDWNYRQRDAERWADFYGIPYREPPSHEFDFELLARAAAAAARLGAAASYALALYSAIYASDAWPLDRALCLEVAERNGLPRSAFENTLDSRETTELLADNAREANARGAFGVPTFFLGEDMYWGNDRLVLLEHALTGG